LNKSYKKCGWTETQRETFERFISERYANYKNPENTFKEWTEEYRKSTLHGRRCKLKAFFRWESGDKNDPQVEKICSGGYVSPVTIHDLLNDDEIIALREVAKADPRDLAMVDFHLLWGPRPSESVKLKVRDVEINDAYIVVNIPQTKTISRPVPIPLASQSVIHDSTFLDSALNAFTSLMNYLNSHPGYPGDPEYPLWYDEKNGRKPLDKYSISRVFKRLGKEAGLNKMFPPMYYRGLPSIDSRV